MRLLILPLFCLSPLLLAACATGVPDSGAGVGFDDYGTYQSQREAALNGSGPVILPGAQPIMGGGVSAQPVGGVIGGAPAAQNPATGFSTDALGAAIDRAAAPQPGVPGAATGAPMATIAGAPPAPVMAQPVVPPAAAVQPARSGTGPNIVDYALRSTNAPGTPIYSRSSLQLRDPERACAAYASADLAQMAFLEAGGPDRDRRGLDPDGDGFACSWDPTPFRRSIQ